MTAFYRHPVRRVEREAQAVIPDGDWPFTLAGVRQLLADGLDLAPVTIVVGENGSGKSTLVEAIALAYGLSAEGGSIYARHSTRASESTLHESLRLSRGVGAGRWGFFLRAETMHGFFSYLEQHPGGPDPDFHDMSHGESFLALLRSRFNKPGFYCLDEPESALSFSGSLGLVSVLHEVAARGGQALVSTHSPIVAATPGARILEIGEWGWRDATWQELEFVAHWRRFLDAPAAYLRHVLE